MPVTPSIEHGGFFRTALGLWRTRIGLVLVPWSASRSSGHRWPRTAPLSSSGRNTRHVEGVLSARMLSAGRVVAFPLGGRAILVLALASTAIGLVVGIVIGLVAAYNRGVSTTS